MARGKTITEADVKKAEQLAAQGLLMKDIAHAVGILPTAISQNTRIKEAVHRGQAALRERITNAMLANLDSTNLSFIGKQQGLFRRAFHLPKITDVKSAEAAVVHVMGLYADGSVTEYQVKTVQSAADSYIKMHELSDIEIRLQALEQEADK